MSDRTSPLIAVSRQPAVIVWAILVALTGVSYWLGADHALGTTSAALSLVLVIAIAKSWLVQWFFMDMRHAPRRLQSIVGAWLAVTAGIVIGMQILL
ncbi:cytochrome C oxidase subunit IV family protein [Mycobacterium xenopi]|uniref:Prokaryotic cytochrome C oxidase subunit IV family protein n=1 Tax=Mycobacterium xenopi TaxID=1789 RepID=A0AAD1LZT8_MYCXE|nr:cytochrome C oxidase subunit IV family protein [Mycobacterium xenopi]MDA3641881.1 cytochrome C oxidase subunit IV family protein [Mycobacterium xenopi]MDA3658745.1 cytochrome C oxidase subunit IV family protein [Mycobacterium xenopi]MDA3664154.1 cytochrome C oxidase subunit IV family protein [Mycobacterium xenopi]ORX19688.1 hypothetical protein AWC32_09070 [Mycobacterium xenopi]SPX78845.1 Uncharacterised protein [Mycobacterium xenopi]